MIQAWIPLRIERKWREATDIYSFELVDPEGHDLPPFTAGSHIDVETAPGLVRQYSLCNAHDHGDCYQICVLREPLSRGGSRRLIDGLDVGDAVRVSAPRNHFELDPSARRSVLIAGGIGITPILCTPRRTLKLRIRRRRNEQCAGSTAYNGQPWAGSPDA